MNSRDEQGRAGLGPQDNDPNRRQIGGQHYKKMGIQHWDYVLANNIPYMEAQVIKYVSRWRDKNGVEDLRKAQHFLDKLIEWETMGVAQRAEEVAQYLAGDAFTAVIYSADEPQPQQELFTWEPHSTSQFTYEGGYSETEAGKRPQLRDLYTCNRCRSMFSVPMNQHPENGHHVCTISGAGNRQASDPIRGSDDGAGALASYVNQA